MAKDDYDVIVYKVLVYLYACLKRRIIYEDTTFTTAIRKNDINDEYFTDVLIMMQEEDLISGVVTTKAWGGDSILLSNMQDVKITAAGIRYLHENSKMKQIGEHLKESADTIAKLAGIIGLLIN